MSNPNMANQALPNGVPPQMRNVKSTAASLIDKSFLQNQVNGVISSQSSRGSSPSNYTSYPSGSYLPPTRGIPASQLPPSRSSINNITQMVTQLGVSNQCNSKTNSPNYTSTPNQSINVLSDPQLGQNNIISPIALKLENPTNSVKHTSKEKDISGKIGSNVLYPLQGKTISSQLNKGDMVNNHFGMNADTNKKIPTQIHSSEILGSTDLNSFHEPSEIVQQPNPFVKPTSAILQASTLEATDRQRNVNQNQQPSQMVNSSVSSNRTQNRLQQITSPQHATQFNTQFVNSQIGATVSNNPSAHIQSAPSLSHRVGNTQNFNLNATKGPQANLPQELSHGTRIIDGKQNVNVENLQNKNQSFAVNNQISTNLSQPVLPMNTTLSSFNGRAAINKQQTTSPAAMSVPNSFPTSTGQVPYSAVNQTTQFPHLQNVSGSAPTVPKPIGILSNQQQAIGSYLPMSNVSSNTHFNNQHPYSTTNRLVSQFPQPQNVSKNMQMYNNQQQQIVGPCLEAPDSSTTSPNHLRSSLHANRYPSMMNQQQATPNENVNQQSYNPHQPQYSKQSYQDQTPEIGQAQSHIQAGGSVHHGFNKLWGMEQYDLFQTTNILPKSKIQAPTVLLGQEVLDAANCSPDIFRATMTKIPESSSLLQKSRLPLGVLIHPFKDLTHLPVIQCNVIVRCRACRTYINPFVFFVDSKRWKCNLCYRINELPEEFQYDPVSKTYGDPSRRPEVKTSTIEYIAPAEYMLRPPQPAVYLFLLDVSRLAIESGYLSTICKVLEEELLHLPGDSRTQVGFITYDSHLHFFSFAEGLSQPHEMMVLDIEDIFLPCPDNLLVNLKDRIDLIVDLLAQLPIRYNNNYDNNSALGSALQAAHKMMSATGGRVTVFQASLPNIGPGGLMAREDPNQRASKEVNNLNPATDFYKRLALECSSQQIAVDLFIVNSQYVDIATISGISRFSGGCIHHFPLFKSTRSLQSESLERSFRRYLTRKIGFEAVMRVRCTRGMSIHTFHGNFFVRSTDLLSLPNVNPDSGYGMQVSIDENLSDVQSVCFQAALLYTSSKGERRIRVHTLCLPVVSTLQDVINSADQQCIIGLLSKMAVDRSIDSSLSDAREAFINVAIDILSSYKLSLNLGSGSSGLLAPQCLTLLPLYISALLKNTAFRIGTSTRLDDRVKAMIDMKTKPLSHLIQHIYPDLYAVHNLEDQEIILNSEEEPVHLPSILQLSSRYVDNKGAYLMDMGEHMFLYISSGVSQIFLNEGLGVPNFSALSDQTYELPILENTTNQRLHSFINHLNDDKPFVATFQVVKDNSPIRGVFLEKLIEDRVENALSYHEFLQHIKAQVK